MIAKTLIRQEKLFSTEKVTFPSNRLDLIANALALNQTLESPIVRSKFNFSSSYMYPIKIVIPTRVCQTQHHSTHIHNKKSDT
jgi:hypothetical protein